MELLKTKVCACTMTEHQPRLVVVTGGPGAGKTALLELVQRTYCEHVVVLPEAASVIFGGGFPRRSDEGWRRAAQRSIYHVQRELERASLAEGRAAVVLCDRGTVDGVAYWPGGAEAWANDLGVTLQAERMRYAAVIQLRTPPPAAYNHQNPLRTETAREAARVDALIEQAWAPHPRRRVIASTPSFMTKVEQALALIDAEIPTCCARVASVTAAAG